MLDLSHLTGNPRVRLLAKAEFMNPGGSVKDRAAVNIIRSAIESGELTSEKILLDSTSGNTGIAYAMICSALGIQLKICIPGNASKERQLLLRSYGADLVLTDPLEGSDGAHKVALKLSEEYPNVYYYANQYDNPNNLLAHFHSTGNEILEQTNNQVTHFITGLGTTGTFGGVAKRLKEYNSDIQTISFQPDSPFHGLEGLKHLETAKTP
ncbi:MAG: PLP-dependent cysteine synthase family protein, partial [Candidatus Kariarchaeaceae archaeon]